MDKEKASKQNMKKKIDKKEIKTHSSLKLPEGIVYMEEKV